MKVVITARNFGSAESKAQRMLRDAGFEVVDHGDLGFSTGSDEREIARAIGSADAVIMGLEPLSRSVLELCPKLRMMSKRAIGYDTVDLEACRERGISVARTAGMVEGAVAEHAMALMLYFARSIAEENAALHRGEWVRHMSHGAKNRVLGLVGFGGIGRELARRAVPFGMEVLYYCRHPKQEWEDAYRVRYASMDELLHSSDYVCACVNLSDSTRGMFGAEQFARMKREAVFINIARSGIMDVHALRAALDAGTIRGAAVDVFDREPCTDSPLMGCANAILTPHTAPFTTENFTAMNECAARNVIDWANGCLRSSCRLV